MSTQDEDLTDEIAPLGDGQKSDLSSVGDGSASKKSNGNSSTKRSRKKSGSSGSKLGKNKSRGSDATSKKSAKDEDRTSDSAKDSPKDSAPQGSSDARTASDTDTSKGDPDMRDPDMSDSKEFEPAKSSSHRQPNPTKEPPKSAPTIETDPDKTGVVDVEKELTRPKQGLLDRLLDTKSVNTGPASAKTSQRATENTPTSQTTKSNSPEDSSKSGSDDLFSNLNKVPNQSDASESSKSSDDFEDLLLGGLSGADTSKIVPPPEKAEHWTQEDHERPTEVPVTSSKSPKSVTKKAATAEFNNTVPAARVERDDSTDELKGDEKLPLGRQESRSDPKSGSATSDSETKTQEKVDQAIHDAPTGEIVVNAEESKTSTSATSVDQSASARSASGKSDLNPSKSNLSDAKTNSINSMRERARLKAAAENKKREKRAVAAKSSIGELKVTKPTAAKKPAASKPAARRSQDRPAAAKPATKKRAIANRTVDMSAEAKQATKAPETSASSDGFQSSTTTEAPVPDVSADVTGEIEGRSRSFKVSTESVKQSLRPPARVRARKVRRVVRHVDPWSVLTFSVLFHLTIFSSLLLGAVLIWQVADASGIIENVEDIIKDLGSYEQYELNGWAVFRAGVAIAGILTLASTVLVVILSVIFNLISDLVGGIRLTVVQEETVRVQRDK